MTHDVIKHLLDDYVTGELPEDARGPVADHIAACGICTAEVASLQKIIARAAELPRSIDPPSEAWSNIRAAIDRDEEAVSAHEQSATSGFWRRAHTRDGRSISRSIRVGMPPRSSMLQ